MHGECTTFATWVVSEKLKNISTHSPVVGGQHESMIQDFE